MLKNVQKNLNLPEFIETSVFEKIVLSKKKSCVLHIFQIQKLWQRKQ